MRFTFVTNACAVVEHNGYRILFDPWLTEGAFNGSWYHWPPLKSKPQDFTEVDAIYISHLHPDHMDIETLEHFRKEIPIVILDHGFNFLEKCLKRIGFKNLIGIKNQTSGNLGPLKLTMYAPFTNDPFWESKIGNLIDSALFLEADGISILNTNDNMMTPRIAEGFKIIHPEITMALLNYNPAGPYPSCFRNLYPYKKIKKSKQLVDRNLKNFIATTNVLEPRYVMPFAGNYILGGKQSSKNKFLGAISPQEAQKRISDKVKASVLSLQEGEFIDLE